MIYGDKTELLRKGLFDVQNEVGLGYGEEAYHQAYATWLGEQGIPFASKQSHVLKIGNGVAYTLQPDFVVWDCITIELKAVARRLRNEELVQLFDYLKCRGDKLGILVNMGLDRVFVRRLVYESSNGSINENLNSWKNCIDGDERELGKKVRQAIVNVFDQHGTGYGRKVTEKLLCCSLQSLHCPFKMSPVGSAYYQDKLVDKSHLDCLVIDGSLLLSFTALFDNNQFSISRSLSYMKTLGIKWGIAVNFGKTKLEITSLCCF